MALILLLAQAAWGSQVDALVVDLAGDDDRARSLARQLLVRESPPEVVERVIPLLSSEKQAVSTAARNVIVDAVGQVGAPGREAERELVTRHLMAQLGDDAPEALRIKVLTLLPPAIPAGYDVGPIARLLKDEKLREKARVALEETATPEAAAALRDALDGAEPAFQVALLNALARLQDKASVAACERLLASPDAAVRVAALRALAWTGDPRLLQTAFKVVEGADESVRNGAQDALLHLLAAMVESGGKWQIAIEGYKTVLKMQDERMVQAAIAGLGRYGDGTCVAPIFAAIANASPRTQAIGLAALRSIEGVDAVRAIVEAYPNQSPELQLALLPVLGGKRHALTAGILTKAATAANPAVQAAAIDALADARLPESAEVLGRLAEGQGEAATAARSALLRLADGLRAMGRRDEAGRVYVRVIALSEGDTNLRTPAAEGLAHAPVAEGYEAAKSIAEADSGELGTRVLVSIAGALAKAGQKDKAIELYNLALERRPGVQLAEQVARGLAEAGVPVDVHTLRGVITRWWLVGPFELGQEREGWGNAYVSEPAVSLAARYMSGKRRVAWTRVETKDPVGRVDFKPTLGDCVQCIGYAYTEIVVKEACEAVLLLGSDDGAKVWVNGKLVHDNYVDRPFQVDQDRVSIQLQEGVNRILLKVHQNVMGWEFAVRLTHPDGRAVAFTPAE